MQRTEEWLKNYNKDYFDRQFETPYRSTVAFCDWLEKTGTLKHESALSILDVGTGKGANLYYMAKRFPNLKMLGVDLNQEFVDEGNQILKVKKVDATCKLAVADLYKFDKSLINKFDGIVSYQTLSWLPNFREPLKSMASLNTGWIALTSLFFDGDVNCKIDLEEYNRGIDNEPKQTFYNVYSLPLVEKFLRELGFIKFLFTPFEIDIDIPKPDHKIMGTYTETLNDGKRLQLSGPLLMNWYFILAIR
jgi:SAM-dependent methyltransferase